MVKKLLRFILWALLGVIVIVAIYGIYKPLEEGLTLDGQPYHNSRVEFLYDLTYEQDGMIVHQQNIFAKVLEIMDQAQEFIVLDMFLFNKLHTQPEADYPALTDTLTQHLVEKKQKNPAVDIVVITDEINNFYGSYVPENFRLMQENDITVIFTDLNSLRDSNPLYSGIWNTLFRWWGTEGKGWLPNIFGKEGPKVTLRSYLKMLNFKANHRKVLVTEQKALISSANPHDASAYHSNIAFVVEGKIIEDLLVSEGAVAAMSKQELAIDYQVREEEQVAEMYALLEEPVQTALAENPASGENVAPSNVTVCLLTEGKIKKHLLNELDALGAGDQIWIGMFYLSDRSVIHRLLQAAERGVEVRLVLDANKDAFGLEKNGIPNKPVANELHEKSQGKIKIRWYKTHGEQYHAKLVFLKGRAHSVIFGGSANLTRRNLADYNLETDLKIMATNDSKIVKDVENYFTKIWSNEDAFYTVDFEEYRETSGWKKFLYLFQEFTGLSTV